MSYSNTYITFVLFMSVPNQLGIFQIVLWVADCNKKGRTNKNLDVALIHNLNELQTTWYILQCRQGNNRRWSSIPDLLFSKIVTMYLLWVLAQKDYKIQRATLKWEWKLLFEMQDCPLYLKKSLELQMKCGPVQTLVMYVSAHRTKGIW